MKKSLTLEKLPRPSFQFRITHASTVTLKNIVLVTFHFLLGEKAIMPENSELL